MDASARMANVTTDLNDLTSNVSLLAAKIDSMERTLRGLRVYKAVQTEWDN